MREILGIAAVPQESASLLLGGELGLVATVGGLGWLVAVYCIFDKHRKDENEGKVHLLNNLLKVTFTSITMVAAVHLSFQVAVHLPDIIRRDAGAYDTTVQDAAERAGQAAVDALENWKQPSVGDDVLDELATLREEHERLRHKLDELGRLLRDVPKLRFADEVLRLRESRRLTDDSLTRAAHEHLASGGVEVMRGELYFRLPGDRDWSCRVQYDPDRNGVRGDVR